MVLVGTTLVDASVVGATFCCDLEACAGACCTLEGGRGAPLDDAEVPLLHEAFEFAREYLRPISIEAIEARGLVDGVPGDHATRCIDRRECVLVYFDNGIARCSLERAYLDGKTAWRKPLSCHLFPLRVRRFGQEILRYEQIQECRSGRERGAAQNVPLHRFLKEALSRAFGKSWFDQLDARYTEHSSP